MANSNDILHAIKEMDELLARLDERSLNTWRVIDDVKKLLEKQNGRIRKNTIAIAVLVGAAGLGGGITGLVQWLS